MKILRVLLLFALVVWFSACKTEFETNAPWKEIDIVYALMGSYDSMAVGQDTAQYFRITKAFLNADQNALKLAQEFDSLYHDTLEVTLQEWQGNTVLSEHKLVRVYNTEKDSGIFAAPGQYLYKTQDGFKLNFNAVYKLIVFNPITKVQATAATTIVHPPLPRFPTFSSSNINFEKGKLFVVDWEAGRNARFYDFTIRINYSEYRTSDSVKIGDYRLIWPNFKFRTTSGTAGIETIQQRLNGSDFYNFIANNVSEKQGVYRRLGMIDFIIESGGEEIYTYMEVNRPSIGLVQKRPEYTNVENGYGIVSSRNTTIISVPLSDRGLLELSTTIPTARLNFLRN